MVTSGANHAGCDYAAEAEIIQWRIRVIDANGADAVVQRVRSEVLALCAHFPVYG
jgi:glycine/serine hydroxymethyltransferase